VFTLRYKYHILHIKEQTYSRNRRSVHLLPVRYEHSLLITIKAITVHGSHSCVFYEI
jgi:hypothetical protein